MPIARSGDVRIRYQTVGEGPTVILHHGGGFRLESSELASWVHSLATDHLVVTFDAMVRAAREGDLTFVSLERADHRPPSSATCSPGVQRFLHEIGLAEAT